MEIKDIPVNPQEKREILTKILDGVPDALIIESGGIKPIVKGNKIRYKTTSYVDEAPSGTLGGNARIIAGVEIAQNFPDIKVVTAAKDEINSETHAKVMAEELIRRGVSKDRVLLEEKSITTLTELVEAVKLTAEKNWNHVAILTNDYHLARNYEMFLRIKTLADPTDKEFFNAWEKVVKNNVKFTFVGAETILPLRSPRYSSLLQKVEETEAFKRRLVFEARGVQALEKGDYKSDPSVNVMKK